MQIKITRIGIIIALRIITGDIGLCCWADYPVDAFNAGTWYSGMVADHEIIATADGMM